MSSTRSLIADLHAAAATTTDALAELGNDPSPEQLASLAEQFDRCAAIARAAGGTVANRTGCKQHPQGAVDPEPVDGWGRCLVCNTNRRRWQWSQQADPDNPVRRRWRQ